MFSMTNEETKRLCLDLLHADTEDAVITLLESAGLWKAPVWRLYGDQENNFSTIGNQQSRPDAALVEKIINSEDARLMAECLRREIDPQSPDAPQSVRAAVALFFDDKDLAKYPEAGRIAGWSRDKRWEIARGITLSATGATPREKGKPCFTIADCGEGQTPDMMPDTLLSIGKSNKLRIPFVQGKFNMGGTGILKFCGRHNFELVISKRDPEILGKKSGPSDSLWGFTIVRRENPTEGARSSVYTYLAPLNASGDGRLGEVLRFEAAQLKVFPEKNQAYVREAGWGTIIKLYEFGGSTSVFSNTNILLKDGLMSRLDLLLAEPALPVRLHECRNFRGHSGSFDTSLTGLMVRLEDDRQDNLEKGFPDSCPLSVEGEQMIATIYAFKKGKADVYRKDEGIVFTVNGQVHGTLSKSFFARQRAGRLDYIANSLLVIVDCSRISGRAREDLFMNSRDRLSHNPTRQAIESQLEVMLKENGVIRELKERRRAEEIQSTLAEEKPLEDILQNLLQHSPALASLFLSGPRASNPFKTKDVADKEQPFHGKHHPTYFKFKGKDFGTPLLRDCNIGSRCRITFETDAVNDYFGRQVNEGSFSLFRISGEHRIPVSDYVGPRLENGIAILSMELPPNIQVGDHLDFLAIVADPTLVDEFSNEFALSVKPEVKPGSSHGERRKPPSSEAGKEREMPAGIAMPNITTVAESEWREHDPPFDKYTALRVRITDSTDNGESSGKDGHDIYDFLINMDNTYLKSELKDAKADIQLVQKRWQYALVLVGLAMLHDDKQRNRTVAQSAKERTWQDQDRESEDHPSERIGQRIEYLTTAIAPVLLPMIESLGALDVDSQGALDYSAESI
jgi:hypothetical protein